MKPTVSLARDMLFLIACSLPQDLLPLAAYLIATSGPKDVEGEEDGMLPAAPTQVPTI